MVNSSLRLSSRIERWPIAGSFAISRGAKTEAVVVVAELSGGQIAGQVTGQVTGRGECVPYARYGESPQTVTALIESLRDAIAGGLNRTDLQSALPPGAARNALDCAFWDFEAKSANRRVFELAGLPPPQPLVTAFTISIGSPDAMAAAARAAARRPLLKIKLGSAGDPERIAAVRIAAPKAELIVDANEGWTAQNLAENLAACAAAGVTLVEQPLPDGADDILGDFARPVPVCADESAHDRKSLIALVGKYDAVNIKLDKTGGLTEALAMADDAARRGFSIMAGCMVSTSLSMAPAHLIAQQARVTDLDGPLLLAKDRPNGLRYDGSLVYPPDHSLWG
jgi:L-alanine-DL-glutamate epimerase-like enolase superfamily enzyme